MTTKYHDKIADHVRDLIREAERDGADDELVGDTDQIVDAVRRGQFKEPLAQLARDTDYHHAFEYLLGVIDGATSEMGMLERPGWAQDVQSAVAAGQEGAADGTQQDD